MADYELYNPDNCYVCNELMGSFRSDLSVVTGYSEKPIYQIVGNWRQNFIAAFTALNRLFHSDYRVLHKFNPQ